MRLALLSVSEISGDAMPVLYRASMATRWSDVDADGHVNNVLLLRCVEEARMQWADSLDLAAQAPDLMPVVGQVGCRYLQPVHHPAVLDIDVACSRTGRSSVELQFTIRDQARPDVVYAKACTTWVWVTKLTGKAHDMPALLRAQCAREA